MTRAERRQKRCCLRSDLSAGPARACLPAEVPAGYQPTTENTYTHTQTNTHCFLVAISRTWNESHLIEPPVMNANTTYLWLIMEPGVFHKEDQNCHREKEFSFFSLLDFTFLQCPQPPSDWLSQIVLWSFSLILQNMTIFTFTQSRCNPRKKNRISAERVTNHSALEERSVEEEHWQQQRNRLWLKTDQRTTNVFLFLLSLYSRSHPDSTSQRYVFFLLLCRSEWRGFWRGGGSRPVLMQKEVSWRWAWRSDVCGVSRHCAFTEWASGRAEQRRRMVVKERRRGSKQTCFLS